MVCLELRKTERENIVKFHGSKILDSDVRYGQVQQKARASVQGMTSVELPRFRVYEYL